MQDQNNRQLLCTFSTIKNFQKTAEDIKKFYEVYSNRVFAFANTKNPAEIYLTYNVLNMRKDAPKFFNTILIHRKKEFNVLYTLNSMNRLIEEENGSRDFKYILNWSLYQNSLIITGDISVKIIPLKIHTVLDGNNF